MRRRNRNAPPPKEPIKPELVLIPVFLAALIVVFAITYKPVSDKVKFNTEQKELVLGLKELRAGSNVSVEQQHELDRLRLEIQAKNGGPIPPGAVPATLEAWIDDGGIPPGGPASSRRATPVPAGPRGPGTAVSAASGAEEPSDDPRVRQLQIERDSILEAIRTVEEQRRTSEERRKASSEQPRAGEAPRESGDDLFLMQLRDSLARTDRLLEQARRE